MIVTIYKIIQVFKSEEMEKMWEGFARLGVHEASIRWLVEEPQPALLWTPLHFLQEPLLCSAVSIVFI